MNFVVDGNQFGVPKQSSIDQIGKASKLSRYRPIPTNSACIFIGNPMFNYCTLPADLSVYLLISFNFQRMIIRSS
jgi:hypothetical protein